MDDVGKNVFATRVRIAALDRLKLGILRYHRESQPHTSRVVVFSCVGRILAVRYRHFASYLAQIGIPVLAFEYREAGASRPASLRGLEAALEDWAEHDLASAVSWLGKRFPPAKLAAIAPSVAGLLVGEFPKVAALRRLVLMGVHTGCSAGYGRFCRLPMAGRLHSEGRRAALVRPANVRPSET